MGSIYDCMDYVITKEQLTTFLRRRFSYDELDGILNSVKERIDMGDDVEDVIYDVVRNTIAMKNFNDINDNGTEQDYWNSYLRYETPLLKFIESFFNLD